MKLSSYSYLFAARKNEFDLDGMVTNFTAFFDETVIATIPYEDDTYDRLKEWEASMPGRLKIVMTEIDISKSNRWDGDLKTAALQACTKSTPQEPRCYVIMDGDERVVLSNHIKWMEAATHLAHLPYDGFLVPVIDLYKDENHIRSDQTVGVKFRLHKDTVVKRGVIPEAEMGFGNLFRTEMSDSTEPITELGKLANFAPIVRDPMHLWPQVTTYLNGYPYVFHHGHLDADRRARLNKEFWREHWLKRSGQEPTMAYDADKIRAVPTIKHQVALT